MKEDSVKSTEANVRRKYKCNVDHLVWEFRERYLRKWISKQSGFDDAPDNSDNGAIAVNTCHHGPNATADNSDNGAIQAGNSDHGSIASAEGQPLHDDHPSDSATGQEKKA